MNFPAIFLYSGFLFQYVVLKFLLYTGIKTEANHAITIAAGISIKLLKCFVINSAISFIYSAFLFKIIPGLHFVLIVLNFLLSFETGILILSILSFNSMFADITESF